MELVDSRYRNESLTAVKFELLGTLSYEYMWGKTGSLDSAASDVSVVLALDDRWVWRIGGIVTGTGEPYLENLPLGPPQMLHGLPFV
jgi:hypothetical protein